MSNGERTHIVQTVMAVIIGRCRRKGLADAVELEALALH